MKPRTVTKWLGKGFMVALDSGVILDFISWLGKRREAKQEAKREEIRAAAERWRGGDK